jgi:hypothetical protein
MLSIRMLTPTLAPSTLSCAAACAHRQLSCTCAASSLSASCAGTAAAASLRAGMPRCGSTGRLAPLPPPSCSVYSQPRPHQGYLTASRCGSRNCSLKGQSNLRFKKRSVCDRRAQAAWACLCQCTQIQFFFNLSRRDLEGMYTAADLFACKEFRLACSGKVATSTTRLRDNCPIYFKE